MFSSITQRLLWKEFRAQQMVWIAIAGELVLLQLWWGVKGHEYADVNLFSMAFVLTGVFAMTTSALLFAGESEARTDGFLRQLPITSRQLIGGKLLYAGLAVTAFLVFALLSTLIAGQMAGKYGGDSSALMGDPSVFALSIVGLAAWGLFYSLLTRKVLWTVIGAALTEVIIGGIVHSILAEYHFPDSVFYAVYTVVIAALVAGNVWLLGSWSTRESHALAKAFSGTETVAGAATPATPLPWLGAFRWSCIAGVASGIFTTAILFVMAYILGPPLPNTATIPCLAMGTLLGVGITYLLHWDRSRGKPQAEGAGWKLGGVWNLTVSRLGRIVALAALGLLAVTLGLVACGSVIVLLLSLIESTVGSHGETIALSLGMVLVSSAIIWWVDARLRGAGAVWLPLLQRIDAVRSRTVRRVGPLLWIEVRRAFPVLLGGSALLILLGLFGDGREGYQVLCYMAMVLAALVCGLLTLLPDRSHGTLAFLTERGVSSTKIMLSKVFVWGGTLSLMLIPWQGHVCRLLCFSPERVPVITTMGETPGELIYAWVAAPSGENYLFVLFLGTFTIGLLAAAWVRRPILAGIVGFSLMLPWLGWSHLLMDCYAPLGFSALVPIALIAVGILWTGTRTLLEQSTWSSKLGQVSWVLLVGFVGLQGYSHFRANEIPYLYDELAEIRNSRPTAISSQASSWQYPFDPSVSHAAQLDSLVDDETKRNSLVQPPGLWGAPHAFQMGIESLRLDDETCDLDAAFEHLRKWHELSEQLAYASRDEDGWIDALKGRRVVLSAIRRWANHPQQTAERLEAALEKVPVRLSTSGGTVIARQYADARRSLETGISPDSTYRQGAYNPSPVTQWFLARTGEKERVRRLIDYYFYLSARTHVAQPSSTGTEFDHWIGTTRASAATLGVSLPWQRLNVRHHGQWELATSAETATRLVLQLQRWRLKHGSFPASFAEVFKETGPLNIRDFLTNDAFHYEPQGFDRDLLAETKIIIPARQPLLYSEGLTEPRGVDLVDVPRGPWPPDDLSTVIYQYQARNFRSSHPSHMSNPVPPVVDRPANPNTIRFSVLGQNVDEDSLYLFQRAVQTVGEERGGGAAAAGGTAMSSDTNIEADPTAPPTHELPLPPPGTLEVPSASSSDAPTVPESPPLGTDPP